MEESSEFPILNPGHQASFYFRLKAIREEYLYESLHNTVKALEIRKLDGELNGLVPKKYLNKLASYGLWGELLFPVPYIIESNPFLLGYYWLLLGFSQKEFYSKGPFGKFKALEEKGKISKYSDLIKTMLSINV